VSVYGYGDCLRKICFPLHGMPESDQKFLDFSETTNVKTEH